MIMQPIVNLPIPLYILGLNISRASDTALAIAPGQARDSLDNIDMPVGYPNYVGSVRPAITLLNCPSPLIIDTAVVGPNGLDSGVLAASSKYLVYLIGDSRNFNPVAGLMSLYSNQYPLLPSGYDSYRLLGGVGTTAGTIFDVVANFRNYIYQKSSFIQPSVSVLAGGNSIAFAPVALTAGVPTTTDTFVIAYLDVVFTPAAAGHVVQIRPTGSTATSGLVTIVGQAAGVAQTSCVSVMTDVSGGQPSIDYKVSAAGDSVSMLVRGYSVTLS